MDKTLLLIDGHSLLHRAYHALPELTSPDGKPVGAVYGFTKMLLRVLERNSVDCAVLAWDTPVATFRHQMFADYKQHRAATEDSFRLQLPLAQDVARAFGIQQFSVEGYEADDVIGTIACEIKQNEPSWQVRILSSDLDLLQLVNERVATLVAQKGITDLVLYTPEQVFARFGLAPSQITELKGLMGDSSDNIPGVKGIGIKTATKLLQEYQTIEGVYEHITEIKGKPRELLEHQQEQALLSRELATITKDVPLSFDLSQCRAVYADTESLSQLLREFGFRSLVQDVERIFGTHSAAPATQPEHVQTQASVVVIQEENRAASLSDISSKSELFLYIIGQQAYIHTGTTLYIGSLEELTTVQDWHTKHIIGFDLKSTMHQLAAYGIQPDPYFDLMLADTIVSYGRGVKDLPELVFKSGSGGVVDAMDGEVLVQQIPALYQKLMDDLAKDEQLAAIFYDIEMPLVSVLYQMERYGVKVDRTQLLKSHERLQEQIAAVEQEIYDDIGHKLNLNSPKQLAYVLFDELGLPVIKKTKTQRSTNEQVLVQLQAAHPAIAKILNYRTLTKLASTYTSKLLALSEGQKRISTQFNQLKVVTARLSSEQPNLQNIPRDEGSEIRRAFVAQEGKVLGVFDYSQIELRILAHLSGEEQLINSFKSGQDIHAATAARLFDCFIDEVTTQQRQIAKTVNFAVLYGMGPHALSESLQIEYRNADKYINDFYTVYPKIKEWKEQIVQQAKHDGYVETYWGRRIAVPELAAGNKRLISAGERMACNYPNQGTQADIIKKAMVEIDSFLRQSAYQDVHMVLQIHDEVILEVPPVLLEEVAAQVKSIMEGVVALSVPVVVDAKTGPNWQDLTKI